MIKIERNSNVENFSIRQMQAYAALCLWKYCCEKKIKHKAIDDLLLHLVGILSADNLPEWDQAGAELAITGRGDPLPDDVSSVIPESIYDEFESFVECAVEVGIVDMYGAETDQPKNFLRKCLSILSDVGIELPSIDLLSVLCTGSDNWGGIITREELNSFISEVDIKLT